jgi:beta-glucosidase
METAMRKLIGAVLFLIILGSLTSGFASGAGDVTLNSPEVDSPEARAEKLLGQMTQEEKISLLGGDKDAYSTHAIKRLGIPKLVMSDGPQGVRNYGQACSFPCGAALAATWDVSLAQAYGHAMGLESRARGVHFILGPGMNICRVPVNGRNFEYFGEDPFLAAQVATNWIQGVQNEGVIATAKHFAGNNQEWHRNDVDEQIDERTLHEIYLPAFRASVTQGGAGAVMCAYNQVDGSYCSASDMLLNQILKKEWGFTGLVMSDWGACHATSDLAKGLDLEMGTANFYKEDNIKAALAAGTIRQSDIDGAVIRILRVAIAMGFMDRPQKRGDIPLDSPASDRTALDIARSAVVLLKNENDTLPLVRSAIHRIAVYGPNAEDTPTGGGGSGAVKTFHNVSFLQGIKKAAGDAVDVTYVPMVPVDDKIFDTLACAQTAVNGQPGLLLNIKVSGNGPDLTMAPTVQQSVNVSFKHGSFPFSIPPGRDATCTFTGVVTAPQEGDWEIIRRGRAEVTVGDHPLTWSSGYVVHLQKDKAIPIEIKFNMRARWNRPGSVKLGLRPVTMPDMAAAKSADAVIVCAGFNGESEHEDADRDFQLSGLQEQIISSVTAANPKTIVVVNSGGGFGTKGWIDPVPALLNAYYLGQEGGAALGEILFGDVNPSGRLVSTFDRTFEDCPAYANYPGEFVEDQLWPVVKYAEGIFIGYRGYDKARKEPLYPFGFGLSYTTFSMANMKIDKTADGGASVWVDVTNTGKRAGAEVVQVYVGQQKCSVERPMRELKGFGKVALSPGQTKAMTINLPHDAFAFWSSAAHAWTVEPGTFTIEAGASERDIRCTDKMDVNSR